MLFVYTYCSALCFPVNAYLGLRLCFEADTVSGIKKNGQICIFHDVYIQLDLTVLDDASHGVSYGVFRPINIYCIRRHLSFALVVEKKRCLVF